MKKFFYLFVALVFLASCGPQKVDVLILNGTVYNGVDEESKSVNIAIKGDQILEIGEFDNSKFEATKVIDAKGQIVSPGFIDPHTHADRELVLQEASHNKPFLFQGITTVVTGNDGESVYPISRFKELCLANGIGTNVIPLTGHGTLRDESGIKTQTNPDEVTLNLMKDKLKQEMEEGSFGLSTGLFYSPGSFSTTDEVISLAKVLKLYNGIYDSHIRDESSYTVGLLKSVAEVIEIGKEAKVPVHISHIKCLGADVWRYSDSIIAMVEKAQNEGVQITANQYPYRASATGLKSALIPKWAQSGGMDSLRYRVKKSPTRKKVLDGITRNIKRRGGGKSLVMIKAYDKNLLFKDLTTISDSLKLSEAETALKLVLGGFIRIASFNMTDYDVENFMSQDWVVTGSDGNTGHPRKYGSFPKKYREYVQEKKLMSLGKFIQNSTAKTAEIFNLKNRGVLKPNYKADIIIFDPNTFKDRATFDNPFVLASGLNYAIINGKVSVDNGKFTDQLNGEFLTRD